MVVLKSPKPDRIGDTAARVRPEARIMATLRHPYIVAYKGQMIQPSWGLLVQFCSKGSLRDRIR
jgi:serine/threonine protein kinase